VGRADLPVVVGEHDGALAVEDAGHAGAERRAVPRGVEALAGRLDADQPHVRILEERVEEAHGVRAAADAGDAQIRQPPFALEHLRARLHADDALEIAHQRGVRMRPHHRADAVVGRADVRDPVAHCLVDGVLERARAAGHGVHAGAEELHLEDVQRLPGDVLLAHVDLARDAEERARRRRGDAVLPGARLRDHALLAHVPREQHLAEDVVDLVGARVREVLALQIDLRADLGARAPRVVERRRATRVLAEQALQLVLEGFAGNDPGHGLGELVECRHERLGHVAPAVRPEVSGRPDAHRCFSTSRTAWMKSRIRAASLR
jgi:hypothetical protein